MEVVAVALGVCSLARVLWSEVDDTFYAILIITFVLERSRVVHCNVM